MLDRMVKESFCAEGTLEYRAEGHKHWSWRDNKHQVLDRNVVGMFEEQRGIMWWFRGSEGERQGRCWLTGARDPILKALIKQKEEFEVHSKCRWKPGPKKLLRMWPSSAHWSLSKISQEMGCNQSILHKRRPRGKAEQPSSCGSTPQCHTYTFFHSTQKVDRFKVFFSSDAQGLC